MTVPDATIAYDQHINNYLDTAGIVLLVYDYLLTLESEVTYIWTKRTRATAWFLFVRYFALCINTAVLTQLDFGNFGFDDANFSVLHKNCWLGVSHALEPLSSSQSNLDAATLILRVLAMYFFDKRVMFTLAITAIVAVSVAAYTKQVFPDAIIRHPIRNVAGAWEALLGADIILLGFTLYRGYTRSRNDITLPTKSLWRVLVQDGGQPWNMSQLLLTCVMCLANLANILMFSLDTASSLSTLTMSLMLNLHKAAAEEDTLGLVTHSLRFASGARTQNESGIDTTPDIA
ncbi:hypothetical protein B0H13DRAFT_1901640 [Mycena leptocephala]|nr:hypothetical protein B0H13DRAFT_1901640 [Mycena leptocephala]